MECRNPRTRWLSSLPNRSSASRRLSLDRKSFHRFYLRQEREKGFEPSTPTLATWCSTPELLPHDLTGTRGEADARRNLALAVQPTTDFSIARWPRIASRLPAKPLGPSPSRGAGAATAMAGPVDRLEALGQRWFREILEPFRLRIRSRDDNLEEHPSSPHRCKTLEHSIGTKPR
jgi:hypothetical protein